MSGPVNALSVLDGLISDMGDTPGTTGHQVAQAREAFAGLVKALCEFDALELPSHPGTPPRLRRLREALARVQGGSA